MFIKHIVSATDLKFKKELVCDITKTKKKTHKNKKQSIKCFSISCLYNMHVLQTSVENIQCCQWIKCEHSPTCVQTSWLQCLSGVWSVSSAGSIWHTQNIQEVSSLGPRSGLWIGSEAVTYHITSCAVRPILTGPTTGLNATPALGRAPLPRSPACPEHVRWAEQMFIAVSVRRKPRGKGGCLVPQEVTRHVASQPCA